MTQILLINMSECQEFCGLTPLVLIVSPSTIYIFSRDLAQDSHQRFYDEGASARLLRAISHTSAKRESIWKLGWR